jgi:predicted DNA-binding protein YlxM (UPF0122 family)
MSINKIELGDLLAVYGTLLTDKQREILDMYCNRDFSLGEIGENLGISRQGVHDAVANSEKALLDYETKLHILADGTKYNDTLIRAKQLLQDKQYNDLLALLDININR